MHHRFFESGPLREAFRLVDRLATVWYLVFSLFLLLATPLVVLGFSKDRILWVVVPVMLAIGWLIIRASMKASGYYLCIAEFADDPEAVELSSGHQGRTKRRRQVRRAYFLDTKQGSGTEVHQLAIVRRLSDGTESSQVWIASSWVKLEEWIADGDHCSSAERESLRRLLHAGRTIEASGTLTQVPDDVMVQTVGGVDATKALLYDIYRSIRSRSEPTRTVLSLDQIGY